MTETRQINEIVWRNDLYPRFEPNPTRIQQYAEAIELLPPIEINQNNELIDGYHRWIAHKKKDLDTIKVIITHTANDVELDRLMAKRNADFGIQLSGEEKRRKARQWFTNLNVDEQQIADDLSVTLRTVQRWLSRKKKDMREEQKQQAFDLWLACWTYEEIGEKLGVNHQSAKNYAEEYLKSDKCQKLEIFADYKDEKWKPPLYNIWKQQTKSNVVSHYGNSEPMILDNLLYMYTEPYDIVVDPFAGGGSTIDICKRRLRRYWVSDRLPIIERLDIRQADIAQGPPSLHKRWSEVKLLYLDPPYWKQSEEKYGKDTEDLANMPLEDFYNVLSTFVVNCSEKMKTGSRIAMLMQPTQWKAPDKRTIDHVIDLIVHIQGDKLSYGRRISCPYESQQTNAQQVQWAKENRDVLGINRELIIWEIV